MGSLADEVQTDECADRAEGNTRRPVYDWTGNEGDGVGQETDWQLDSDISNDARREMEAVFGLGEGKDEGEIDKRGQRDANTSADQSEIAMAHDDETDKENGIDGLDEKIRQ